MTVTYVPGKCVTDVPGPNILSALLEAGTDRIIRRGDYVFKQDECGSSLIFFFKGLAVESKRYDGSDCWITEIENRELEKLAATSPSQFETLYSNLGTELGKKVSNINFRMHHVSRNPIYRDYGVSWYRY